MAAPTGSSSSGQLEDNDDPVVRLQNLPKSTLLVVEALKGVEVEQSKLQYLYKLECLELEKKYASLRGTIYNRRRDLIIGAVQPTHAEIEAGEKVLLDDYGEDYTPPPKCALNVDRKGQQGGIPDFWLTTLLNHPNLYFMIAKRDEEALKQLTNIECTYFTKGDSEDSKAGYKLSFHFRVNDYFTDRVLEKTYYYRDGEVDDTGELLYDRAVGSYVHWKDGKDLTQENNEEAKYNDNDNEDERPTRSFFNLFYPRSPPSPDMVKKGEMEEEAYNQVIEELEDDIQCGEDIRDEVIPYAISYYVDPPEDDYDDSEYDSGSEGSEDEEDSEDEGGSGDSDSS